MAIITGARPEIYSTATAPSAGTDEVQTLTRSGSPTTGTWRLRFEGVETATLAHNASAAAIQTALRALPSIGSTGCTCAGGAMGTAPVTVTFQFDKGRMAVPLLELVDNQMDGGGTVGIVETTPGVTATHRGAPQNSLLRLTTNGVIYAQTSANVNAPSWTVVHTP